MGISAATFKRALAELRNEYQITILPPSNGGYKLDERSKYCIELIENPFSESELAQILTAYDLLGRMVEDDMQNHLMQPIVNKIKGLFPWYAQHPQSSFVTSVPHGERQGAAKNIKPLFEAIGRKKRIRATYFTRSRASSTHRDLSPQKLVQYRGNWYLIAWCHQSNKLKTFAIENLSEIIASDDTWQCIDPAQVHEHHSATYGIFGGAKTDEAILIFSKERSHWVADENWHPNQRGHFLTDGRYKLTIPIGDNHTELVQDLMKYGHELTIVKPHALKQAVVEQHYNAINQQGS